MACTCIRQRIRGCEYKAVSPVEEWIVNIRYRDRGNEEVVLQIFPSSFINQLARFPLGLSSISRGREYVC